MYVSLHFVVVCCFASSLLLGQLDYYDTSELQYGYVQCHINFYTRFQYIKTLLMLPAWYAQQGLCNDRASVSRSVYLSVCLSHRSTAATATGGFAAERSTGRRYRSTAASAVLQEPALSSRKFNCSLYCCYCMFSSG